MARWLFPAVIAVIAVISFKPRSILPTKDAQCILRDNIPYFNAFPSSLFLPLFFWVSENRGSPSPENHGFES